MSKKKAGHKKEGKTFESSLKDIGFSWWLMILCTLSGLALSYQLHYSLPSPIDRHPTRFSEKNAMDVITHLSETIGYRIVGTREEKQSYDYISQILHQYQQAARGIPGAPKFDIWIQQGTSSHRFDIMDKMVLKAYTNVTNIIARLSCPIDPEQPLERTCEQNAVLLNSHFDTTLGSPGATDDGSGTAVMIEILRVLSQQDWTFYRNSIVFLFNGAEESLQDASHAFITMHEIKDTIRSVVNIDACGTTGKEILFQANSREMVEAYKQVPYPHGTVMANDVFRTGLILSDTDFRQFVQYGHLTGIDLAIYKNSYLYHTHLDLPRYLEPGAIQHLGENTLAIVRYLAQNASLVNIQPSSDVVFFDFQGLYFFVYDGSTAYRLQMMTVAWVALYFVWVTRKTHRGSPYRSIPHILIAYAKSILAVLLSMVSALLLPISIACLLTHLDRPMSWFRHEWYGAWVFSPMGLIGAYGIQYLALLTPGPSHVDPEYGTFQSLLFFFGLCTFLTTLTGIASSYIFWLYCSVLLLACGINERWLRPAPSRLYQPQISRATYALSCLVLSFIYADYAYALVDLFVPLTGRMGVDTPVDAIVAVIYGMIAFMVFLPSLAHVHRFGQAVLAKLILLLCLGQGAILIAVSLGGAGWAFPYDALHPKRLFVQHLKNLSSGEISLGLAQADQGPYLQTVVQALEQQFNVTAEPRTAPHHGSDWDSIYPFSAFLGGYRLDLLPYLHTHLNSAPALPGPFPELKVLKDHFDPATGIRSFTLLCLAPTYTWTVLAFDGHVVDWSIQDEIPQPNTAHYVVRHVSGYGNDGWTLHLAFNVPLHQHSLALQNQWKVTFEFTALEEESFANAQQERPIGDVRVLTLVQNLLPDWTSTTWLSSVVQRWEL
ncbi:hypothetical protein BY458DRAFT_464891 [Sporodiniella umbellata]|nr:hypothetical protein BY458DRAFT_464891 [Sporodiniella umbellata]